MAFAFDPGSAHGAAVGSGGSIWSTDDDGATWTLRRTDSGVVFVRVWARARTVLVMDGRGALFRSTDRGFSLEALADPGARIEVDGDDLLVVEPRRTRRLDTRGVLHSISWADR